MRHASLPIDRIEAAAPADDNVPSRLGLFFLPLLKALHESRRRQAQRLMTRYRDLLSDVDGGENN